MWVTTYSWCAGFLHAARRTVRRPAAMAGVLALCACGSTVAVVRMPSAERQLELQVLAVPAEEILFQLSFALQPLCSIQRGDNSGFWSSGLSVVRAGFNNTNSKYLREHGEAVRKRFAIEEGQGIVFGDQSASPQGVAKLQKGDIVLDSPAELAVIALRNKAYEGATAGSLDAPQLAGRGSASSWAKSASAAQEQVYGADPINRLVVQRDGKPLAVPVRVVKHCGMSLEVTDSKFIYADSNEGQVMTSRAMLQELSLQELRVVLAHEAAQVALGLSKGRGTGKAVARLLFGKLSEIGQNVETELSAPKEMDLIRADMLALRMAYALGVEPPAYLATLKKLVGTPEFMDGPKYWRTRPLGKERLEKLEESIKLWSDERKFFLPSGTQEELLLTAYSRALRAARKPEWVFSPEREPLLGAPQAAPSASQFAALENADAVPGVSAGGRDLYKAWLLKPFPRAVAISEKGTLASGFGDGAMTQAINSCERDGEPCLLYAVDDVVVWRKP